MQLIIDVGNTRIKIARYIHGEFLDKVIVYKEDFLEKVLEILKENKSIRNGIISSVDFLNDKEIETIKEKINLIELTHELKLPFFNLYSSPKTLGVDRIALIAAAANKYNHKNVLVIDAGTCVTFDFLNHRNEYLGGAISPGLTIRYEALHKLTAKLPLLKPTEIDFFVGNNTKNSIHSGVVNGLVQEIDGVINQYKATYKDLTVILTGGDTNFLAKSLKSSIFANSNFLLDGLSNLLEINLD